jgi:CRISPR-associated protein Cmr2
MSHLLLVAIGPVQDFIAAARRTADLQAGSGLLVEIARTVAQTLEKDYRATLIFPARESQDEQIKDPPNKVLVELPEGIVPCTVVAELKKVAQKVLTHAWDVTWGELTSGQRGEIDEARAKAQVERFLEFYGAWIPLTDGPDSYKSARLAVERKLAGRKALREFEATPEDDKYLPKSPLDPAWPTVVKLPDGKLNIADDSPLTQRPLFLKSSELLDAISLIKRVRGFEDSDGTPSTAEMAIRLLQKKWPAEDSEARLYLQTLARNSELRLDFGDLFFAARVEEEQEQRSKQGKAPIALAEIQRNVRDALEEVDYFSSPPYYAILLADGDRMGKLIGQRESVEAHQIFSRALAGFAGSVHSIVRGYSGHLIYSGGDDVLALLPVHTAIACAWRLHQEFDERLKEVKTGLEGEDAVGTLSVGIAIVHYREPLQISLERARQAEKAAKNVGRDALSVALHTRGGAPVLHAARWGKNGELSQEWAFWTEAFDGPLSRGLPYELRELARMAYRKQEKAVTEDLLAPEVLQKEAQRIVLRKRGTADEKLVQEQYAPRIPLFIGTENVTPAQQLEELAGMLTIARFLARPEGEGR